MKMFEKINLTEYSAPEAMDAFILSISHFDCICIETAKILHFIIFPHYAVPLPVFELIATIGY